METYKVTRKHGNNIIEEDNSLTVEACNIEEAKNILIGMGAIIHSSSEEYKNIVMMAKGCTCEHCFDM